jgi:hypothetical protein
MSKFSSRSNEVATINYRTVFLILASILTVLIPVTGHADYQISPNPNYDSIGIENGQDAYNSENFINYGAIGIIYYSTLTNNAGATLDNEGSILLHVASLDNYGTLINSGDIRIDGTLENYAGGLFVNNGYVYADSGGFISSGTVRFDIAGTDAGLYGVFNMAQTYFWLNGGNLEFDFVNGFTPTAGDSWDFIYGTNYQGQYTTPYILGWDTLNINVDGLGDGLGWEIVDTSWSKELKIIAVPEPNVVLLLSSGLVLLIVLRRWNKHVIK